MTNEILSDEIRVLVFGSTGVGKTSLCNTVYNIRNATTDPESPKAVSDSARGTTFESYPYDSFALDGSECILTDTVGLNESSRGRISGKDAITQLISLLKNSKKGYNLLIQVVKIGSILQTDEDNYELFVKTITGSKIPRILVVTGCENVAPMTKWAEDNAQEFAARGLKYSKIVCTCFAKGTLPELEEIYSRLRLESQQNVLAAISEFAEEDPVPFFKEGEIFERLKYYWNAFCDLADLPLKFQINEELRDLLVRLGCSAKEAEQQMKDLFFGKRK